jgi:release factor glutamine methyltransferase
MQTIAAALAEAAKLLAPVSASAVLDAEVLLCLVLAKGRPYLRAWPERELDPCQISMFTHLLAQRQQGQPVAYLTGKREFWSREFLVTPDVLIPRPETERLIELGLKLIPQDQPCTMIDLGTGSGIIAVTLAVERPQGQIIATDISAAALAVASANAAKHQASAIQFVQSHWFDAVPEGAFDFIFSNPPYLAEHDEHLRQGDLRYEPKAALIAAGQGLGDIEAIAQSAYGRLSTGGYLMVEHGYAQGLAVHSLFMGLGYRNVQTWPDYSGLPRVAVGQR